MRREWYAKADALARSRGERDIETPPAIRPDGSVTQGGQIRGGNRLLELPPEAAGEMAEAAQAKLEAKLAFLESHAFASAFERRVWACHCKGMSARSMAGRVGRLDRKSIDRAMQRLTAAFEATKGKKKPGRPRRRDSLRSEGMRYELRLTPAAALALDHIRTFLVAESPADIIRRALVETAKRYGPK